MDTISARLWERFGSLTIDDLPDEIRQVGSQCVLDWFACALAGSRESLVGILRDELAGTDGPASLVGTDRRRAPVLAAAMVNGAAGHALDYDDTHMLMNGHPTVPVLPAALAQAEEQGATGAELLTAFVVGVEVECRVAAVIGPEHYAKGWHATSSMGVFGATAAAGRLLGLDEEAFGRAFGLAASQSGGLKANFGTMTKPFHAGHAAEQGLRAARLAAQGYTANPAALEGNQGLAQAAGRGEVLAGRLDEIGGRWTIRDTLFKYHAACYLTHASIEATRRLRGDVKVDDLQAGFLTVHPSLLDACAIPEPRTGLEAKFSLAATNALALLGEATGDPATYDDDRVNEPAFAELVARFKVETDPSVRTTWSKVRLETASGTHEAEHDSGVPAVDLDAQGAMLRAKFDALATPVLGAEGAARLATTIAALPSQESVGALLA